MKRIQKWISVCLSCGTTIPLGGLYCAKCDAAHRLAEAWRNADEVETVAAA